MKKNDLKDLPAVEAVAIINCLVLQTSFYTKEQMKAFKELFPWLQGGPQCLSFCFLFFTKDLIPLMSLLACYNHSTLFLSALTIGIVDCIDMIGQILKGPEDEFV